MSEAANRKLIEQLAKQPANFKCADCGFSPVSWVSLNLGIFICIQCSGIHRQMGTSYSQIRSITLDKFTTEQVEMLRDANNIKFNLYWESKLRIHSIPQSSTTQSNSNPNQAPTKRTIGGATAVKSPQSPPTSNPAQNPYYQNAPNAVLGSTKINSAASDKERTAFIFNKYQYKRFYDSSPPDLALFNNPESTPSAVQSPTSLQTQPQQQQQQQQQQLSPTTPPTAKSSKSFQFNAKPKLQPAQSQQAQTQSKPQSQPQTTVNSTTLDIFGEFVNVSTPQPSPIPPPTPPPTSPGAPITTQPTPGQSANIHHRPTLSSPPSLEQLTSVTSAQSAPTQPRQTSGTSKPFTFQVKRQPQNPQQPQQPQSHPPTSAQSQPIAQPIDKGIPAHRNKAMLSILEGLDSPQPNLASNKPQLTTAVSEDIFSTLSNPQRQNINLNNSTATSIPLSTQSLALEATQSQPTQKAPKFAFKVKNNGTTTNSQTNSAISENDVFSALDNLSLQPNNSTFELSQDQGDEPDSAFDFLGDADDDAEDEDVFASLVPNQDDSPLLTLEQTLIIPQPSNDPSNTSNQIVSDSNPEQTVVEGDKSESEFDFMDLAGATETADDIVVIPPANNNDVDEGSFDFIQRDDLDDDSMISQQGSSIASDFASFDFLNTNQLSPSTENPHTNSGFEILRPAQHPSSVSNHRDVPEPPTDRLLEQDNDDNAFTFMDELIVSESFNNHQVCSLSNPRTSTSSRGSASNPKAPTVHVPLHLMPAAKPPSLCHSRSKSRQMEDDVIDETHLLQDNDDEEGLWNNNFFDD